MLSILLLLIGAQVDKIELEVQKGEIESGKRVTANLKWTSGTEIDHYVVYKKRPDGICQSISAFSFTDLEPVRVLNVYPDTYPDGTGVSRIQFGYSDGTTTLIEKSSALKVWMESGWLDDPHLGYEEFENLGRNLEVDGEQSIVVDLISVETLNKDASKIWEYDVVAFGTWDAGGRAPWVGNASSPYANLFNVPNDEVCEELRKYIEAKYGVIASHDSMGSLTGTGIGLARIRDLFGIKVGLASGSSWYGATESADGLESYLWWVSATQVKVVKYGDVVDFPWSMSGRILDIPQTHTLGQMATADVWIELTNVEYINPYTGPEGIGNTEFYLTTKNNTAMIHTGHSQCQSTSDERKIWANLIYYLKQRTTKTERVDHSSVDEIPPLQPTCSCVIDQWQNIEIQCSSEDGESTYGYRVEGYSADNTVIATSDEVFLDLSSGIAGYFMYSGETESVDVIISEGSFSESGRFQMLLGASVSKLQVVAVDNHGHTSPITDVNIESCTRSSNTFTENMKAITRCDDTAKILILSAYYVYLL